jgi:hypothetical protein
MTFTAQSVRATYFNEGEDAPSAFRFPGWRGTVLFRDRHGVHGMPRELWDALRVASPHMYWWLGEYARGTEADPWCRTVPSEWGAFARTMHGSGSPDCVLVDPAECWAVLVDIDCTVLGCSPDVARVIDARLAAHGSSLRTLSDADYGDASEWSYRRAVLQV